MNFKIFNLPGKCKPDTTVLRKRFLKYCIIPLYSNTAEPFKLCAGQSYFRTINSHCSSRSERKRQIKIVELILRKKGFSKAKIKHMKTMAVRKKQVQKEKRKFVDVVTFDSVKKPHMHMRNIFNTLDKTVYHLPWGFLTESKVTTPKLSFFLFNLLLSYCHCCSCHHVLDFRFAKPLFTKYQFNYFYLSFAF